MSVLHLFTPQVPRLFYIYDPMCSWCYAFTESWSALQRALPEHIEVTYVLGGLAPDSKEPMPTALRTMIQQTWQRIEKLVPGIQFNYDFWIQNTPLRSTYPACRAILAAQKQNPLAGQKMLHAIQHAYYQNAKNPSLSETLIECAETIDLDTEILAADLSSEAIQTALMQELLMASRLNAFSFPSLCLEHLEKHYPIAVDYLNYKKMLNEICAIVDGTN